MFLPEIASLKIEMIPAIDKESVVTVSLLLGLLLPGGRPRGSNPFGLVDLLALTYVLCPLLTSIHNQQPLVAGERVLPGVGLYDAVSAAIIQAINLFPFYVGRRHFGESSSPEQILRALIQAGLIYSALVLLEVRLSPVLHSWVYGFFQSSFVIESRLGGFRSPVFMRNGLVVAFFMLTCALAATTFWRLRIRVFGPPSAPAAWLSVVLVLCKAAGSLLYLLVFGPVIRLLSPHRQVVLALTIATIGISYPILRASNLFPSSELVQIASSISEERAASLKTRFDQEEQLLAHASERFLFGWGRFGRSRVYDEYGKDITLTDGRWIITFGTFGALGFLAEFGLLVAPIFGMVRNLRFSRSPSETQLIAALTTILAVCLVEQLPNDCLDAWVWLIAGAVFGQVERLRLQRRRSISGTNALKSRIGITPGISAQLSQLKQ
ncbi:hypothetical protein [Bradyrhizobium sp. USDA 4469]